MEKQFKKFKKAHILDSRFWILDSKKGFTLIEVIIYSGILALFFAAILVFVSNILGSVDSVQERNEVLANQEFIERKLNWILHIASQIQIPTVGATTSELKVLLNDASTADFVLSGNILTLKLGAGNAVALNSLRTNVTNFSVANTTTSPTQISVSLDVKSVAYPKIISSSTFFYVLPK